MLAGFLQKIFTSLHISFQHNTTNDDNITKNDRIADMASAFVEELTLTLLRAIESFSDKGKELCCA
jgi:hypothetical protein